LHAEVVGDLVDEPQPVAVLAGPGEMICGRGLGLWFCASPCGLWLAVVGHLAVQRAVVFGDEQPSVTGAVADGVDGEFMDRKNDVTGAGLGHPGPGGVGGYGRAQRIQRSGIEILRQNRGASRANNIWPGGSCRIGCELIARRLRRAVGVSGHEQSPG
jgi:hypothetical protein